MIETSGTIAETWRGWAVIETSGTVAETWRGWSVIETSGTRRHGGDGH